MGCTHFYPTTGGTLAGAASKDLTVIQNNTLNSLTISSVIADNTTATGLAKSGAGTLTLTATDTYTGATNVNAGILAVNGSLANTVTSVRSGAILQGAGSIVGSVTIQNGGTLASGTSTGIESLATGALTLQSLATFAYQMNKDAAASAAGDLTAVTGALNLDTGNTAILTLTDLGTGSWANGEEITLISYSGSWNNGLFNYSGSTLADDSTFTFSGQNWRFNYNDTSAGTNFTSDLTGTTYVTMTAIPEPSVALLGRLSLLGLALRRRRRD
jgi:autotransporter-associated beta strand protein